MSILAPTTVASAVSEDVIDADSNFSSDVPFNVASGLVSFFFWVFFLF